MNTYLAKNMLHLITFLRKQPLWQSLQFLEDSQWWTYKKIQSYQEMKLATLLKHCVDNVPFYKKWFKENGYKADDINMQNLHLLPVIDKSFLRENLIQFIATGYKEPIEYAKTSGSTGVPLLFPKSLAASAIQLAAMYRGHKWHGVELGDKEARLWGIPVNKKTRYLAQFTDILLNRFREKEYNLSHDVLNDFCARLAIHKPAYLMGYTSMVAQFARYLLENDRSSSEYKFKMVKCTSETIHDSDRKIVESVFGCSLVSEYGAAETGLISFQCKEGSHHLMSDCCIVEFIDPKEDVGDLRLKEVLVTNLDNFAMPIVRYRIGDLAIPSSSVCSCGRELPLVEKIVGRVSDIIKTSDGGKWHSIVLYYIMKGLAENHSGIMQFKVIQKKLDNLEFLLVIDNTFTKATEDYLRRQCYKLFGEKMEIDITYVDQIPREPSGKLRDFISTI
jgi:phenylacetate-CoA ligase